MEPIIMQKVSLEADVVVIGGGLAGMSAAIAAARSGAQVILIQDRPVLGGNQSSEMQVGICGADASGGATARYVRETGIIEELWLEHMHRTQEYLNGFYMQDVLFWETVTKEPNIRLLLNTSAMSAVKNEDGSIGAITAVQVSSEKEYLINGKIFIDASGDSRIAVDAGADSRSGREGKYEYDESMAPEDGDKGTMGSSIFFNAKRMDHKVPFTPPDWAYSFPRDEDLPFRDMYFETFGREGQLTGFWWLEYGGCKDTVRDSEEIRDELYKIVLGIWDHLKNHGDHGCDNYDIVWMNVIPAKRESRRLMGEYIVSENDVKGCTPFEDRVAYGGWPIDVHPPEGIFSKEPPCTSVRLTDVWNIPFRSLYSRNVPNLMMAGRNISVTHVALGSARVMATCALMGQAVGTAAGLCVHYGIRPKDILKAHMQELQQKLLKNDCYIKDLCNEDPADLARTAKVHVSSQEKLNMDEPGELFRLENTVAQLVPVFNGRIDEISLLLQAEEDVSVTLRLFRASRINEFPLEENLVGTATAKVVKGEPVWTTFVFRVNLGEDTLFWLQLDADERLNWSYQAGNTPIGTRAAIWDGKKKNWNPKKGSYTTRIFPESCPYNGTNVINGVARPEKWTNLWISDSSKKLPQYLELDFQEEKMINTVYLTFDTDLDTNIYLPEPNGVFGIAAMPSCVKDYDILGLCAGNWICLWSERGNYQRHKIHHFANTGVEKIRIEVLDTNGDASAKIYEIRCYKE